MADRILEGFDHYGLDENRMLEGAWAQIADTGAVQLSNTHVRTGNTALKIKPFSIARRVVGAETADLLVSLGVYFDGLPPKAEAYWPIQFRAGDNTFIATVIVRPDGVVEFHDGERDGTLLGSTAGPVIVSGAYQHMECQIHVDAVTGTFELRVDEIVVMDISDLDLGVKNIAQYAVGHEQVGGVDTVDFYIDDLIIRDIVGPYNDDFQGDLRVATLQPIANGVNQGWATRSIQNLGVGVGNFQDAADREKAIAYADSAAFEIGAQDFCVETFIRFDTALLLSEVAQIGGKYRADNDQRSWRLKLNGPDVGGTLVFETNTLGTLADAIDVHAFPFVPELNRKYHVAVSREGTTSRMFIAGQQVGIDKVDNRSYFDSSAQLFVNSEQGAGNNIALANSGISGWMDGFRLTVGSARYTANFVPPTDPLPINVGGDALYADVQLLLNFDTSGNVGFDESANVFAGTAINGASFEAPDDAEAFKTIDGLTPNDYNFVEASLVPATGTYTLTANPLDTETLTLGATTYTFQTVLVDVADNVLIGVDAETSLDNLLAAVNLEAGVGVLYGTGTVQNVEAFLTDLPNEQVLATARTPGAAGNAIVSTTTVTGASWGAATLAGGQDIPANSEFTIANLPPEVTGVRSVAIIGRNFKTDSGAAQMTMSFVEEGGALTAGPARALTVNPVYYHDIFEQDPSTAGALTPSTLLNARVRVNRTL